jgi:hypothetical protein
MDSKAVRSRRSCALAVADVEHGDLEPRAAIAVVTQLSIPPLARTIESISDSFGVRSPDILCDLKLKTGVDSRSEYPGRELAEV